MYQHLLTILSHDHDHSLWQKLMTTGEAENLLRRVLKTRAAKMGEDVAKYETQRILDDRETYLERFFSWAGLGLS